MMTKLLSLSIAGFILAQSFNIHIIDILKLNNLMSHMEFHKTAYGDDVFAFVAKHYGDQKEAHKNEKERGGDHQKLPFNHSVCLDATPVYVFDFSWFIMDYPDSLFHEAVNIFYQASYSFLQNSEIFQPPRL